MSDGLHLIVSCGSLRTKGTDLGINKDSSFHFQDLHLESLLDLNSKIDS
jgi:hypothetical protein